MCTNIVRFTPNIKSLLKMSKHLSVESKFRSFSPPYFLNGASETGTLYEKHRNLIHQQISQLPNSPKSKEKIEQTFEEMLKSIHFFKKPDIIPFPYLHFDQKSEENLESSVFNQNLSQELEKEKIQRKTLEKENTNLKERLSYLIELQKQYEEYKLKSLKNFEFQSEIDKLNVRIKLLIEENDYLKKKSLKAFEYTSNHSKYPQELDKIESENFDLKRQLEELSQAYEGLREAYTKDLSILKDKYDRLYSDKILLEKKLQSHNKPEKDLNPIVHDNNIQEKIRNLKHDYRDKLRNLEKKLPTERPEDVSDIRLKEIEDRLSTLQNKLTEKSRLKDPLLSSNRSSNSINKYSIKSRGSTPTEDKGLTNYLSWRSLKNSEKSPLKIRKIDLSVPVSTDSSKPRTSRSPGTGSRRSPTARSLSRKRLYENHAECETCIRKHGHEWAKSPR